MLPAPPYDALSIAMLCELVWFLGYDYTDRKQPGNVALVARPSRLAPAAATWAIGKKTDTVCCVVLAGVVGCVYDSARGAVPAAAWSVKAWKNMMVQDVAAPWSVTDECLAAGIGTLHTGAPVAGRWYVAQGWKGLVNGQIVEASTGHQWLQWGPDLMVEATTWTDEDGDDRSTDPGAVAWRVRTWAKQSARYDEVRLVALR